MEKSLSKKEQAEKDNPLHRFTKLEFNEYAACSQIIKQNISEYRASMKKMFWKNMLLNTIYDFFKENEELKKIIKKLEG